MQPHPNPLRCEHGGRPCPRPRDLHDPERRVAQAATPYRRRATDYAVAGYLNPDGSGRGDYVAAEACPRCPYSLEVHVAPPPVGTWLGCPPDEAAAVARWGRA